MKNIKLLASTVILATIIAGCGSDGSNPVFTDSNGNVVGAYVGYLTDSPVGGVTYTCSDGKVSLTQRATGKFTCNALPVTFSIGKLTLGSVSSIRSDSKVLPQDLANVYSNNYSNAVVEKLSVLLQSLDEDSDKTDIYIAPQVAAMFIAPYNVADITSTQINTLIKNAGYTPISTSVAISHLQQNTPANHYIGSTQTISLPGSSTSSTTATIQTKDIAIKECDTYVQLLDNDVVKSEYITDTVIKVISTIDGNKKICTVSGDAYIQRAI